MANVKLSKEELALVTDPEIILTKNRIIQKVYDLFGALSEAYSECNASIERDILSVPAKISKGENYLGLPWVMLDYPRKFSRTDVFAVRTFFWWGKFFSITLQLQGRYKEKYTAMLQARLSGATGWWICPDTSDAWQHHFDNNYYVPFIPGTELDQPFIKLAKKIPLEQWDNAFDFFGDTYKEITGLLSAETVK